MPYPSPTLYPSTSLLPGGEAIVTPTPPRQRAPDRPHFAFPFARSSYVEQDTADHVGACVNVILRCPLGFRLERPEFGWPFPEFQNIPLDLGSLREAVSRFEPRADLDVSQYTDAVEAAVQHVPVDVRVQGAS